MTTTRSTHGSAAKARGGDGLRFGLMWPNSSSQSIMSGTVAEQNPDILDPDVHRQLAHVVEDIGLDYVFFADSYAYNGDASARVGHGEPRLFAPVWASLVIAETRHVGVVTTLHARYLPAVVIARLGANLDVLSGGRWGWNVVPGAKAGEAELFGLEPGMEHDRRYAVTTETVRAVKQLWAAGTGAVDFDGEHVRLRGALSGPSPVQRPGPVIFNPGVSPAGLALTSAECDFAFSALVEDMDKNRAAVQKLAAATAAAGRPADAVTLAASCSVVLGSSRAEAEEELAALEESVDLPAARRFADFFLQNSQTYQGLFEGAEYERLVRRIGASAGATVFVGTPADVAEQIRAASDHTGVRNFLIAPLRWAPTEVARLGGVLEHLRDAGAWKPPAERGWGW